LGDREECRAMNLRLTLIAAGLVALTSLPAAAQQFAPGEPAPGSRVAAVRTVAALNLRSGPGTQYRVLIRLPRGAVVQLLGCIPNFAWCRTSYLGRVGWVSAAYLSPRPGARAFPPFPPPFPLPVPQPPFPQPPQAGTITVTGTLTREGVECPAMRGDNGRLYTLAGGTRGFDPGDRVRVTGTIAQVSFCQQGTTIQVRSIVRG
jgi:hypothetical protein